MALADKRQEEPADPFSTLTSLNEFDKIETRNAIRSLIDPKLGEIWLYGQLVPRALSKSPSMSQLD